MPIQSKNTDKISLREAISIGIGGMVGGGIFAVLGLAVSLAQGGTPIAFFFAGIIASLTAYSYSKLSLAFPDRGGTVKFINQGFGKTVFSGTINNLLWVSYIVMLSLYASAFGSYAPNLYQLTGKTSMDSHIYLSAIIVLATVINYYSISVVSKIESFAVIVKLIILLAFVGIGIHGLFGNPNLEQLAISNWESPLLLLTGGMVIFVAYEGFELIANAAPDIVNPEKNVSKAYNYSVWFVVFLYVIIAIVTVGSLPFKTIAKAEDYVLAEAAKPMLGQVGFTIITIAALISTFSAINASLYGGSRVSFEVAEDDELPHHLTSTLWNKPIGLLITAVLTLLIANTLELESISTAGSAGFLLIFAIVNYVAFKLSKQISGKRIISLFGFLMCAIAFITLLIQQYTSNFVGVIVILSIILCCFVIEYVYKKHVS
ncbi:MAG: amino acid transporter [Xanthomarina sp.]|uniref:APC family permease n=1 Tax=Xanthomarina sp. TaxID=1931211 RepID=UPI000C57F87A|nr:APC family permease [Xanthomarina sp.]MAL23532.1 amino acid transporter [Xanthomarina sp.]MBF61886.1 amino acid transporter [Xanthomarina sp.]HAB27222.1 amino acid transporter [Xanthomarina gelatinilytica]HAI16938.1 amino acid transporter [Xanthomarina gelatinilytica]|tara:strand:- start:1711 stop:3003 length:1293 start_codon:yes stop_codon:yes gene_type:complete